MTRHPHYTRWPDVEGYCSQRSYRAGEVVEVHAASRASSFAVEVTRVGATRERMWRASDLSAADLEVPPEAWAAGCGWPIAFTIPTEAHWPSGFYEIGFVAEGGDDPTQTSEAFFALRPAGRPTARALVALSTNTYNAYNQWGGRCLYSGAERVSFHRPIERGYLRRPSAPDEVEFDGRITDIADPSDPEHTRLVEYQRAGRYPLWTASSGWHNWERRFVAWAERAGIAVDVAVNSDLHDDPRALDGYDVLVSVGHDEYWTSAMRDTVDAWVDAGGNWAILSGNTCFWQVRYEDDGNTMVCHKGAARHRDPVRSTDHEHLLTSMWSDPLIGRPETLSTGLTFTRGGYHRIGAAVPNGTGAYTVHRPDHWAFAATGLEQGEEIGEGHFVVGYEVDGCALEWLDGLPHPTHEDDAPPDLEILATAPARLISITDDHCEAPEALWASIDPPGDLEGVATLLFGDAGPDNVARLARGHAVMGSFIKGAGIVFNAGSADWAYGLDADPVVQQITENVLRHLGA